MGRIAGAAALSLIAISCMEGRSRPTPDQVNPLDRALAAMGGEENVRALQTIVVKGTARHWEPHQSVTPDGEMRLAGDSTFVLSRSFSSGAARIEWDRKLVYPSPREYRFTEVVTPSSGYVDGIDTTSRTKRDLDSNPPRHSMSALRLAAAQRELLRSSPRLILEMKSAPASVREHAPVNPRAPALDYRAGDVDFTVAFDPETGLPSRVGTRDADNVEGDSTYDLVLSDWRDVSGVKIAHRQSYELNGREVLRIQYDEAHLSAPAAAAQLEVPAELRAAAAPRRSDSPVGTARWPSMRHSPRWRSSRKPRGERVALGQATHASRLPSGLRDGLLDRGEQHVVVERLRDKIGGAGLRRAIAHRELGIAGDEDHRDVVARSGEHVVQVETALTGHPDVQHSAAGAIVSTALQEIAS